MLVQDERHDLLGVAVRHAAPRHPDIGEDGERHSEGDGHLVEAVNRDRFLPALNLADELAAQLGPLTERLLTEPTMLA